MGVRWGIRMMQIETKSAGQAVVAVPIFLRAEEVQARVSPAARETAHQRGTITLQPPPLSERGSSKGRGKTQSPGQSHNLIC